MNQGSEREAEAEPAAVEMRKDTRPRACQDRKRDQGTISADGLHWEEPTRQKVERDWMPPWARGTAGGSKTASAVCDHPARLLTETERRPIVAGDEDGSYGEIVSLRCQCGAAIQRETLGRVSAERESDDALTPGWREEVASAVNDGKPPYTEAKPATEPTPALRARDGYSDAIGPAGWSAAKAGVRGGRHRNGAGR